ncbi:MAG: hypothetical protein EBX41_04600, partial [Chitinophagia bacterium]|nr:hypothetical protein [Chitinophagia bacterium]
AKKYFGLMEDNGRLPHNNFATFNAVSGNFSTAEEHYSIAANQDQGDKRLQEWAYYMGIINIYKADPKKSISIEKGMIKSNGITPGYGWYNIALARALCYDGQIAEAEKYAKKAAEFKEVHIGTTLGQTHYDFSIQLLQLIAMERHFAMLRFENSNWWYNPSILTQLAGNATEKYLQQLLLINQLAQNPERDQVIYNLFSNESTISWDEVWHLVKDYSTPYFIKKFSTQAQNDKRPKIRKYFKLFNAKLLIKQGKYKEAQTLLDAVLQDPDIDAEYEKLYLARIFEAQAICSKETGKETQAERWTMQLYTTFPQLIPFTDLKPKVVLQTDNSNKDPYYGKVIARLKDCNLNRIKTTSDPNALYFSVALTTSGKNKSLVYSVANSEGQSLLAPQTISCEQPDSDAVHLAYALFNVGGTKEKE